MAEPAPAVRPTGRYRPGVAQVRLTGPPETIDAALGLLADMFGDAWQPSTRKPGRHAGGDLLQYGTLIVPVPREGG
jgi:hypothetical protein